MMMLLLLQRRLPYERQCRCVVVNQAAAPFATYVAHDYRASAVAYSSMLCFKADKKIHHLTYANNVRKKKKPGDEKITPNRTIIARAIRSTCGRVYIDGD